MDLIIASFHPVAIDVAKCAGRRNGDEDRHWTPFVYHAEQCKNAPVSGSDLCETCQRHWVRAVAAGDPLLIGGRKEIDWHGRVTDFNRDSLPANSHIAGSGWFFDGCVSGKIVRNDAQKPLTAKKAAGLPRAPCVPDLELRKFLRGESTLDIEELSGTARQISGQQLRDMLCALYGQPDGAEHTGKFDTKPKLCAEIRRMMVAGAVPDLRFRAVYCETTLVEKAAKTETKAAKKVAKVEKAAKVEAKAAKKAARADEMAAAVAAAVAAAEARAAAAEASLAALKASITALVA